MKVSAIEGIGAKYEAVFKAEGISTVESLLKQCVSKKDRKALSEKVGVSEKLILKWANHADLMRIKGIGGEYSELLEAAGVDTVPELANRNAGNLHEKMVSVNDAKHLVRKLPTAKQVSDWVEQAKALPRVLKY